MKNNYLGNVIIAFAIGLLLFYAGARACEHYPFLAKWMGGSCWFDTSEKMETATMHAGQSYLEARTVHHADADDEVTKAAIYALGQNGSAEAIEILQQIVGSTASMEIKKAALHALTQCQGSKELIYWLHKLAQSSEALDLRKTAIYAIGQAGEESAIAPLVQIATSGHHVSLRKAAVHALQNMDIAPAKQALFEILADVSSTL